MQKNNQKRQIKIERQKIQKKEQDNNNKTHIHRKIQRKGNIIEHRQRKKVDESQEGRQKTKKETEAERESR